MMHPGLAALNGKWDKAEYAAVFRARFASIPDSEQAHHCWRVGWEDADTELLELSRHSRVIAEGREDHYRDTRGLLFDARGDARGTAYRLMIIARLPGKKVGSMPTSTLAFMG